MWNFYVARASSLYYTCSTFPTSPAGGIHKICPWNQYPVLQTQLRFEKSFTQILYVYSIHAIDHWAMMLSYLYFHVWQWRELLCHRRSLLGGEGGGGFVGCVITGVGGGDGGAWPLPGRPGEEAHSLCSCHTCSLFNTWIVLFPLQFPLLDNSW